jgi:hypothetical protein
MPSDARWEICHHESGHGVAAYHLNAPIHSIWIGADDEGGEFRMTAPIDLPPIRDEAAFVRAVGQQWSGDGGPDLAWVERHLVVTMAGPATSALLTNGDFAARVGRHDILQARSLVEAMPSLTADRQLQLLHLSYQRAAQLVLRNWAALVRLASVCYCSQTNLICETEIRRTLAAFP